MKHLIMPFVFAFATAVTPVHAAGEVKEVCKDKVDAKGQVVKGRDGKPVQVCKKIKVHKKVEGTKVPPK